MNDKPVFSLKVLIKRAWVETKGVKWPIWSVFLVLLALFSVSNLLLRVVLSLLGVPMLAYDRGFGFSLSHFIGAFLIEVITIFIIAPFLVGAQRVALKHIRGEKVSPKTGFQSLFQWKELGATLFLFWLGLVVINIIFGFFILLFNRLSLGWLSGIVLVVSFIALCAFYIFFMFNGLLVVDQKKGPIAAMGCSAKLVAPEWIKIACLFLYSLLIAFVSFLPSLFGVNQPIVWISLLSILITIGIYVWLLPHLQLLLALAFEALLKRKKADFSAEQREENRV